MKKVLIIGGAGPTGKFVSQTGIERGHEVKVLTRSPDSSPAKKLSSLGCEVFQGDLDQTWTLWRAMEGVDAVINSAHLRYSRAVIQAANQFNAQRFIAFSSTRIESAVPCPTVDQLKHAEKLIQESQLDYTIVRPSMIIGHGNDRNTSSMIRFMKKYRCLPLPNGGKAKVQPVGVHDVAQAVWNVLDNDETIRQSLTLAGSESLPFKQFVKEIQQAHQVSAPLISVPVSPLVPLTKILRAQLLPMLKRFAEDKAYSIEETKRMIDYNPESLSEIFERQKKDMLLE